MRFPVYDWSQVGTQKQLEEDIGNGFKLRLGWTECNGDTTLVVRVPSPLTTKYEPNDLTRPISPPPAEQYYCVYVWNCQGIRKELAALLGEPVHVQT